jgi:hypothetical protein
MCGRNEIFVDFIGIQKTSQFMKLFLRSIQYQKLEKCKFSLIFRYFIRAFLSISFVNLIVVI